MKRGRCPTVHEPMPSGDGLLARVKPFGGRLGPAALQALADAAAEYGNGIVELTGRGNLQVRGVHAPAAFALAMVQAGLADANPAREARRNVATVPPCDDALVARVEAILSETPGLPPKFGVVVDGDEIRVWRPIATLPVYQGDGVLLFLPFGQTDAAALATLAALGVDVRTTPWRAFLSPVAAPGFDTKPGTIIACPGAPACRSATVPAREDARRLAAMGLENIHVSGCDKGCAYPRPSATLVGRDGRYDLVRNGRAGDPPHRAGLTLCEAAAAL